MLTVMHPQVSAMENWKLAS